MSYRIRIVEYLTYNPHPLVVYAPYPVVVYNFVTDDAKSFPIGNFIHNTTGHKLACL